MSSGERPGGEDLINLRTMTSEQFALLNENIPTTPNSFRHSGTAAPMTLKEQEKVPLLFVYYAYIGLVDGWD